MQNDVKPVPGAATPSAIDQSHMVTPAQVETPGTQEENAKAGGRIDTVAFAADETRPQDLHGSVNYQKITADPGAAPAFYSYTELTAARGTVKG